MYNNQSKYEIRCEWGERGLTTLAVDSDAIIIVDVLSFSTCVAVAVHNGAIVYPFYSEIILAEDYAHQHNALLATKQRQIHGYNLSPSSLIHIPLKTKIVLPSPNGSKLSTMISNVPTFAGCLRNAKVLLNKHLNSVSV